jgi:hypothetical protein
VNLRCLLLSLAFGVAALVVVALAVAFPAFASAVLPFFSLSITDGARGFRCVQRNSLCASTERLASNRISWNCWMFSAVLGFGVLSRDIQERKSLGGNAKQDGGMDTLDDLGDPVNLKLGGRGRAGDLDAPSGEGWMGRMVDECRWLIERWMIVLLR